MEILMVTRRSDDPDKGVVGYYYGVKVLVYRDGKLTLCFSKKTKEPVQMDVGDVLRLDMTEERGRQ